MVLAMLGSMYVHMDKGLALQATTPASVSSSHGKIPTETNSCASNLHQTVSGPVAPADRTCECGWDSAAEAASASARKRRRLSPGYSLRCFGFVFGKGPLKSGVVLPVGFASKFRMLPSVQSMPSALSGIDMLSTLSDGWQTLSS